MTTEEPGDLISWLNSHGFSEQAAGVADGLKSFGVVSPKDLTLLPPDHLLEVLQDLNLSRKDQIKLNLAVRRHESEEGHRVVLTPKEDEAFKRLSANSRKAQGFLKEIQVAMASTEKHACDALSDIDNTFAQLTQALIDRKSALVTEVKAQKKAKTEAFQKQGLGVSETIAKYSQARSDSERLLKITSLDALPDREGKIRESIANASALKLDTQLAEHPEIFFRSFNHDTAALKIIEGYGKISATAALQPHPTIKAVTSTATTLKIEWCPVLENQEDIPSALQYDICVSETEEKCVEGEVANTRNHTYDQKETSCTISDLKRNTNYSVQARTMNENGWGNFGTATNIKTKCKAMPDWMETGDECNGFMALWGSPTVFLAVSKSNKFPDSELVCPDRYHWASLQECQSATFPSTSRHPYYNRAGWKGYTFNNVERQAFLFCDKKPSEKLLHSGQAYNKDVAHRGPFYSLTFAGLVCIKD